MSSLINTRFLEDLQSDFDGFLAAKDWKNAHAAIDSLYEQGFEHEGMILAKALAKAQFDSGEAHRTKVAEFAENRKQEILSRPMTDEDDEVDEEGDEEDIRDMTDRAGTFPR